jgi:antitoxin VapB
MKQTTILKSSCSQVVCLPSEVALPVDVRQVDILCVGGACMIVPSGRSWDDFFAGPGVSGDFMAERGQPPMQERDPR